MNGKLFLKQYVKMFAQNCVLPIQYALGCRKPVRPNLVVFADAHHDGRPESMELLYEALKNHGGLELREMYLNYQKASPRAVMRHMFAFMKLYAQAGCVVICDNFLPAASCRKRRGTRVVQLWHACGALKKFGYDTTDDIPKQYHGNVFRNTSLVTVSAPHCVEPFASAMKLGKRAVQPLGISRTDLYFRGGWREACRTEFYRLYPQARGKRVVLWAPTFRGSPGAPVLPMMDLARLQQRLGEDWLVLCRVHPHMHERYKDMDCKMPTERLFPVVDVLIADYSSLIFEYLLFDKPLVLYAPDLEEYQKKRGFYFDYADIPGYQVRQEEALPNAILQEYQARKYSVRQEGPFGREQQYHNVPEDDGRLLRANREQFLETYMSSCDGYATQRIVEYIVKER